MQFDKLVTIQSFTQTPDNYGTMRPTFAEATKRWANLQDQGGGELYRAQRTDATISAVITLREKVTGMLPTWRVVYGSRIFNIRAILGNDDRDPRIGVILHCTEEVGDAS